MGHFGDIEGVRAATETQLLGVVSLRVAKAIRAHFHEAKK